MTTLKIELPFSGFYESWHDHAIDDAIEQHFTYDYETGEDIELTDEIADAIWSADVNWGAIRAEYCEHCSLLEAQIRLTREHSDKLDTAAKLIQTAFERDGSLNRDTKIIN